MGSQRVPNRAPEATRTENCETLIFDDSCKDFNDFSRLRAPSWRQTMGPKWVPNRSIDAGGVRKPLEMHFGSYHSALGALLGALGRVLSPIR